MKTILAELSALPANLIVRASSEIAIAARLGWQPLMHNLGGVSGAEPIYVRDLALMRRNPDYAWLFLFHPNGHAREAALDAIQTPPTSPFFLAALAWRLNDWAEPVRRAAERCVRRILNLIDPKVAADTSMYLLGRRLAWGRWSNEADTLDAMFAREDVLAAVAARLRGGANGPLGKCLRNALRFGGIDAHLPELAANALQPLVRAIAHQCLLSGQARWIVGFEWAWIDKVYGLRQRVPKYASRAVDCDAPFDQLIWQAARDTSVVVRRIAADALIADHAPILDEDRLIAYFAGDANPSVRARADFLHRRGQRAAP
ncbi:hypothetical protein BRAS3843_1680002 [Bradyrhizobium sp. STM 3843]|nr:hypothetical protein BRAS3843_1680002 [Bradyrhizobium sp. STM 3843]